MAEMKDRVKEVASEEFEQAKILAKDAVQSGAYLYPIKVRSSSEVAYGVQSRSVS